MTESKSKSCAKPASKPKPPLQEGRRLGYARVSTYGQTADVQLEQLKADLTFDRFAIVKQVVGAGGRFRSLA